MLCWLGQRLRSARKTARRGPGCAALPFTFPAPHTASVSGGRVGEHCNMCLMWFRWEDPRRGGTVLLVTGDNKPGGQQNLIEDTADWSLCGLEKKLRFEVWWGQKALNTTADLKYSRVLSGVLERLFEAQVSECQTTSCLVTSHDCCKSLRSFLNFEHLDHWLPCILKNNIHLSE